MLWLEEKKWRMGNRQQAGEWAWQMTSQGNPGGFITHTPLAPDPN